MKTYFYKNPTLTLSFIVVSVCALRFLFDGLSLNILGHTLDIGHMDPLAYGSILTPVLGAHGYVQTRRNYHSMPKGSEIDNPDA